MYITDVTQFDQYRFSLLVAKITNTKESYTDLFTFYGHLKGRRYQDDNRIARMIIGDIYAEVKFDIEKAKEKFLSLNSTEIEPYIKRAVLDSASADWYYENEKIY